VVLRSLSLANGTLSDRSLPGTVAGLALAQRPGPALGDPLVALAGEDVRLLGPGGEAAVLSPSSGLADPRLAVLGLGTGPADPVVVAWTAPALAAIIYHLTSVNSAQMPYFKAPPGAGTRIWVVAAGDSVGLFVTAETTGGPGGSTYLRLQCR
jgi:hypothetical protein